MKGGIVMLTPMNNQELLEVNGGAEVPLIPELDPSYGHDWGLG